MRKIDRRIVIIAALIFIVAMAYGLMKYLISLKEEPPMRPAVEAKRFVKTETVAYSSIYTPVSEPGRLSSIAEVDIIAEASGKIQSGNVPLKKSSSFSKGDKLFVVYPDEAALALKARKSQYLNILANIIPDIRLDFPDRESDYMEFFSSISSDKPLPKFPEIMDEKLRIFLTTRNVLGEYYSIQKDELQLRRHTVYAPFDGTYTDVYLEVGAYTNTGGRVAHAIRTNDLELEVPLQIFDAKWVKIGDNVTARSETRDLEWTGKVLRKSEFVDENSQRQSVFVRLNNTGPKNTVLSGEYLSTVFPGHPVENVMEIPRNAVFNTNEVFVVVDGRLENRTINIIKTNERTLIFNGLEVGEIIVVQPLINVLEGTLVEVDGSGPKQNQKIGDAPPKQDDNAKPEKE